MDWSWVQTFVVAAELGSQNAAARKLGLTQPTVGRHLESLEELLQTTLFVRSNRGVELTDDGRLFYEQSQDLTGRFDLLERSARGTDEEPAGPVRLSVNEPVGVQMLTRWYREMRESYPKIELEIVIDNRTANLSRRDADIAVRMFQPEQQDLVARHVGTSSLSLYAHKEYIWQNGTPELSKGLDGHTLIGQDRDPTFHRLIAEMGLKVSDFPFRSDALLLHAEAVLQGVGIGALHDIVAARYPDLIRVLPEVPLGALPLWVVTHESLRRHRTIWTTYRSLAKFLEGELRQPACQS